MNEKERLLDTVHSIWYSEFIGRAVQGRENEDDKTWRPTLLQYLVLVILI